MTGRPELATDRAYATPEARLPHIDEVFGIVEEWTKKFTKSEVLDKRNEIDVPCGPIMSTKDLIEDESLVGRMVLDVAHPKRGTFKTIGCPLQLSDSPVTVE